MDFEFQISLTKKDKKKSMSPHISIIFVQTLCTGRKIFEMLATCKKRNQQSGENTESPDLSEVEKSQLPNDHEKNDTDSDSKKQREQKKVN